MWSERLLGAMMMALVVVFIWGLGELARDRTQTADERYGCSPAHAATNGECK